MFFKQNTKSQCVFIAVISIIVFLGLLPLSLKINFMQNDDWYYYETAKRFMTGNFSLMPEIAPTLYLQILLAVPFIFIFGANTIPVATLIVSTLCFFVFSLILNRHFKLNSLKSLSISFLLLFNPLFGYSIWGFMTENFYLVFFLGGLYFFIDYVNSHDEKKLKVSNLIALFGFFIRQISLFYFLGTSIYFFLNRKFKIAAKQLIWFVGTFVFYELIFPKTYEMQSKGLQLHHFLDSKYVTAVFIGSLIYLAAFTLPLVWIFIFKHALVMITEKKVLKLAIVLFGSLVVYVLVHKLFYPEAVSWGEFPYFENIFERKGFYPRSIHGTKYHFIGIYDLYFYWEQISKVTLSLFVGFLFTVNARKLFSNAYLLLIFTCLFTLITTTTFYDRYILVLVPLFVLFLLDLLKKEEMFDIEIIPKYIRAFLNISIVGFVLFLGVLFYQFSSDFISVENFVWSSSKSLVVTGVAAEDILGSSAWNEQYQRSRNPKHLFSYDSPSVNKDLHDLWKVVLIYEPEFFGSFYIDPAVYLYERK